MPRYIDKITGEITELHELADPSNSGYHSASISLDEWYGAQDPVEQERRRLDKMHGRTSYKFIQARLSK